MKLARLLLASATFVFAQQPTIDNAKLETRAFSGSMASEISKLGPGPLWVAWSEPIITRQHNEVCSWNYNNNDWSGRTPGTPVRLEGEIALVVLVRIDNGQTDDVRVSSPDCHLDAGGLPFYWLTGVPAAESVAWLKAQVPGRRSDNVIMMISLHQGPAADQALDDLVSPAQTIEIRKRAATWLGNSRGAHGVETLKKLVDSDPNSDVRDRALQSLSQSKDPGGVARVIEAARSDKDPHLRGQALQWLAQRAASQVAKNTITNAITNDPDASVREKAVNAIGQLPNGEGVPILIDLAKNNHDPAVRKRAMTMLGQSKDPRALDYFAQVLKP